MFELLIYNRKLNEVKNKVNADVKIKLAVKVLIASNLSCKPSEKGIMSLI